MCKYHFHNICWSDMNLNAGGGSGNIKRPLFCFLNADTHTHTHLYVSLSLQVGHTWGSQDRKLEPEQDVAVQTSVCSLGAVHKRNNIHSQIQPSHAKYAQSELSFTVCSFSECSTVTLPIFLVPKSADVVSGWSRLRREAEQWKMELFWKPFRHLV